MKTSHLKKGSTFAAATAIAFAVILGYVFWGDTLDSLATLGVIAIIAGGWLTAQKTRGHSSPE